MMRFFHKKDMGKRVMSMVLAIVMVFTMFAAELPGSLLTVKAAEGDTNITVHFDNSKYNWGEPALQYWGGTNTSVSGYVAGPTEISGWGGAQGYTLTNEENGWYSVTLTGDFNGFQFLDMSNPAGNTVGKGYSSYMTQYTDAVATDLYFKPYEDNYNGKWYTDAECTTELAAPADAKTYDVTIHYYNVNNWSDVYAYSWNSDGNPNGGWPGTQISENANNANWYDVTIEDLAVSALNFKYNNGAGAETGNYSYTFTEEQTELWVANDTVTASAPDSWGNASTVEPEETATHITLHFNNNNWNWGAPAIQFWGGTKTTPSGYADGPTEISGWGGAQGYTLKDDGNGWYSITLKGDFGGFQFLDMSNPNNNTGGKGYSSYMTQYKAATPQDLYYQEATGKWFLEADYKTELSEPADATKYHVVIHYYDVLDWGTVTAHMGEGESWSPIAGYENYKIWPGVALEENAAHPGWFDLDVTKTNDQLIWFIFSNNGASQTPNTSIDVTSTEVEAWFYNGKLLTEAPTQWTNPEEETVNSIYYAKDVMEVKIGEETYPMSVFVNGIFETTVSLEAGTYTATLVKNGVETEITAPVTLDAAGDAIIRLQDDVLTKVESETAAITGTLALLGDSYVNWNPASEAGEMTYLGGGLYQRTLEFAELEADTTIQYKVAFNDDWAKSIGNGTGNIEVTIPSGRTSFTVFADDINGKVYDDVRSAEISVNGAAMNPFTTTVSLIGTVRGNADDWAPGAKGYEFTRISDTLYRYEQTFDEGTYSYKAVFNYGTWYEKEGTGNKMLTFTKDDVKVVFLYDTESGYLYDTVNNEAKVASLLSMKVKPAEMEIVENANGTATFIAVAETGQEVFLYYGNKADVEEKGAEALTKVEMGAVSNGKSTSEELWLGDEALDIVYYYEIAGKRTLDGSRSSVMVDGVEYSNFTREAYKGRVVNVPGTFPGPSWDASSNVMTYIGNRTYSYTFKNVPAAKYEFKIAVNGSWAENYGANGAFDGGNMKVAVPTAQDVTIYYSDVTHLAVNSIEYKFANITLSGKNIPEGTKLTDEGLTGIYSVTVTLPAGTYDDVVITCDGKEYKVSEFTLKEEKKVTFCMDPVSGLFYHDGSDVKIETEEIYFDSKDEAYKSVYGAVATGEEVTFTLATGTDITSASLIIKGNENKSVPMTKAGEAENGVQKWSATTSFAVIGEYTYYFAVSNGASVKVYGDDDGYYGVGKVDELTSVQPYDLVVYQAGYKTPDWMKNAVVYQIFPDRFYDGDASNNHAQETARGDVNYEFIENWYTLPENPEQEALLDKETYLSTGAYYGDRNWSNEIYGGDLQGIIDRIDYLKALGVTVIYLNPVFSSISSHRYDACDYTKIDPVLGTEGDFAELVKVAEKNGMKVVLDGVFNHVSDDSIYFDRYYKFLDDGLKTVGAYPYWAYVYDYMSENDVEKDVAEAAAKEYFTAEYGITDYSYTEWFDVFTTTLKDDDGKEVYDTIGLRTDKPVYGYDGWWGYDSMPIIKSTNGSEYQTGDWAEEIIYSEDKTSVTQYWISKGMDGWRLDVANEVSDETWQRFRKSVKGLNSDAVIIGEIWDDATKYILGDMYDSVMNYMFRNAVTSFAMGTDAEQTTKYMEKLRERYPKEAFYAMMNLVGSHDTTRILSYLDGIGDDRNQKDIDSAFPTYEKTSEDAKQRQYLVAFLQFTYAGAPTIYYGDEIGMVGSDDPDDRRAFEWGKGNKELVTYYATLAKVRSDYAALRTGSVEPFNTGSEHVLGYVRRDDKNTLIVLANNSAEAVEVTLNLADLDVDAKKTIKDILDSSVSYEISGDMVTVTVAPRRGAILADKNEVHTINVNDKSLAAAYDAKYIVTERPVKPVKPNKPNSSGNTGSIGSGTGSVVTPERPVTSGRPGNGRRPRTAETTENVLLTENEETQTTVEEIVVEEVTEEAISEDTQIAEEETPLAAGAEATSGNVVMIILIIALLGVAAGSVVVLKKKNFITR